MEPSEWPTLTDTPEVTRPITIVAAVFALLFVFRMLLLRRKRRGLSLAVIAFLFLTSAAGLLIGAVEEVSLGHRHFFRITHFRTTDRMPPRPVLLTPQVPPLSERFK